MAGLRMAASEALSLSPTRWALPIMSSSTSTLSAIRATAQASGLPPKVEPWSPGLSTPSTWVFESTAETG